MDPTLFGFCFKIEVFLKHARESKMWQSWNALTRAEPVPWAEWSSFCELWFMKSAFLRHFSTVMNTDKYNAWLDFPILCWGILMVVVQSLVHARQCSTIRLYSCPMSCVDQETSGAFPQSKLFGAIFFFACEYNKVHAGTNKRWKMAYPFNLFSRPLSFSVFFQKRNWRVKIPAKFNVSDGRRSKKGDESCLADFPSADEKRDSLTKVP